MPLHFGRYTVRVEEPPAHVFYKGYKYRRYPDSPQRSHRVYYQRSVPWGVTYLHRDIWGSTRTSARKSRSK